MNLRNNRPSSAMVRIDASRGRATINSVINIDALADGSTVGAAEKV